MRLGFAFGVLACAALPGNAQSVRIGGVCILPAATDTVDAILTIAVNAFDPRQRIPSDYVLAVAQEIGGHIAMPPGMRLGTFGGARSDSTLAYPAETMMASFTLDRTGAVVSVAPVSQSLSVAFDSLVLEAVRRTGAAYAIPPAPPGVRGDTLEFRLVASVGQQIRKGEVLVARLRIPAWRTSRLAVPVPPHVLPQYPESMRRRGIEGEVVVEFVVGTDSLPVLSTLRVVRQTDVAFWEEVRQVIPRHRVAPAMIGDCPVPMRVSRPFNFSFAR